MAKSSKKPAPQTATSDMIDKFGSAIIDMNRLLDRVSRLDAFTAVGLHMAEWQTLSLVADVPNTTHKMIAKKLDVSLQRAQQLCDWLLKREFISTAKSEEDARRKLITITPAGEACLTEVREKLTTQLNTQLKDSESLLNRFSRAMRAMRALGVKQTDAAPAATAA